MRKMSLNEFKNENDKEITKESCISPGERQIIIDDLRLL